MTGPQADTLTKLSASVAALQASPGTASAPTPAKLPYRFVTVGAGCDWLPDFAATRCTCQPGEVIVSPGAWGGPKGVLSGSRFERAPDETASDVERARIWTFSCLSVTGEPIQCIGVQALCVKL